MVELVRGPLVWVGFILFLGGLAFQLVVTARLAQREKTVYPTMSWKYGLRSIAHWAMPFGSRNMRIRPWITSISWAFHICLLVVPLFVMGHAVLWEESWGLRWWSLPPRVADGMTLVVIGGGAFFLVRRLVAPEVRNVTEWKDFLLVLLVIAPFVTGFVARYQWLPYDTIIVLHIVTGVLWLVAIPFTWLAHMLWFVFSRAYMGSEFGEVRKARDW
jgi:nitrate reductase gamma subunit